MSVDILAGRRNLLARRGLRCQGVRGSRFTVYRRNPAFASSDPPTPSRASDR